MNNRIRAKAFRVVFSFVCYSLNGLVVDQSQWVVQPATFFPVGIIQSLWDDPHGRKQVQGIFNNLCMKVDGDSSRNSFGLWRTVKTAVE